MPTYKAKDHKGEELGTFTAIDIRQAADRLLKGNEKVVEASYDEFDGTFHVGKNKVKERRFTLERIESQRGDHVREAASS